MKPNQLIDWLRRGEPETMARFGDARLVKQLSGKLQLIGGTPDDRTAAKEWVSLFLQNAAVSFPPSPATCSLQRDTTTKVANI